MAWWDDELETQRPESHEDDPYYAQRETFRGLPDPWAVATAALDREEDA